MDGNSTCGDSAYTPNCKTTMKHGMLETKCTSCNPGYTPTKTGTYLDSYSCSSSSGTCKGFDYNVNSPQLLICNQCDNGLKVSGNQCVNGGISLPNCKYAMIHSGGNFCTQCKDGYFNNVDGDGCVRSSQYLGFNNKNPFHKPVSIFGHCDTLWANTGFEILDN